MTALTAAHEFMARAQALDDTEALKSLLADATSDLGFSYFALVRHANLRRGSESINHLDNYPAVWTERFVAGCLFIADPILHASTRALAGFPWARVGDFVLLTTDQRHLLESARREGIGEDFTVPANVPGETNGSCSFAARAGCLPTIDCLLRN